MESLIACTPAVKRARWAIARKIAAFFFVIRSRNVNIASRGVQIQNPGAMRLPARMPAMNEIEYVIQPLPIPSEF